MPYYVYVSVSSHDRVNVFSMDPETGALDTHAIVAVGSSPTALCVDPQQRFLYVALRSSRQAAGFRIDKASGRLAPLGTARLEAEPIYISTDRTGRFLFTSYYRAGMAAVHPIRRDGSVGTPAVMSVKTAERAHSIQTDPSNRFAFVPHTAGPNLIHQFRFDETTGRLSSNPAGKVTPPEGAGPRHFCFNESMDVAYFVNEQGSTVSAYSFDPEEGTLTEFQTVTTLPSGFEGENTCADIRITPTGEYVYASNRGHDSIAWFPLDDEGMPSAGGHVLLLEDVGEPAYRVDRMLLQLEQSGVIEGVAGLAFGRFTGAPDEDRHPVLAVIQEIAEERLAREVLERNASGGRSKVRD